MKNKIILVFKGFVIGIANIIPGVSGGTLALILGIYERFIRSLSNFSLHSLKTIVMLLSFKRKRYEEFKEEMRRIDALFLLLLLVGLGAALVAFSSLMTYLIENHHDITYGFFFGLILASVKVPLAMIKKYDFKVVLMGVIGIAIVVALALIQSDADKIASAQRAQEAAQASGTMTAQLDIGRILMVLVAGMLATSAMILPGISGSFISLLLGQYFFLLAAIATGNILVLLIYIVGAIAGIKLFAKFMEFLFKKFHNTVMAFLTGLVIGSLYVTWPFKGSALVGSETVYLGNVIPVQFGMNEILTIATAVVGVVIVIVMIAVTKKTGKDKEVSEIS